MLKAFVEELDTSGIAYCVLSGLEKFPEARNSDVDLMVATTAFERIAGLLRNAAERCGALLVQAMQHETTACYFVLAKRIGRSVAYLHPDCCSDYRREGRLWMRANEALANRTLRGNFFIPSIADEFHYYLIKKVLKQSIDESELERLAELYVSSPSECCSRVRRLWTESRTRELASAIERRDIAWMRGHLEALRKELLASRRQEGPIRVAVQLSREWRRRFERVAAPSGFAVGICGGTAQSRVETSSSLENALRPAFRRTKVMTDEEPLGVWAGARAWLAQVRSTLVIRTCAFAKRARWARRQVGLAPGWEGANQGEFLVINRTEASAESSEDAAWAVLHTMAQRLERRMKLKTT